MKMQDLQVGDWFTISYLGTAKFYVVEKQDNKIIANSPTFLDSSRMTFGNITDKDYLGNYDDSIITLIGKSKLNFWYKLFKWTDLVHPVKMIPLKKWQMVAINTWLGK